MMTKDEISEDKNGHWLKCTQIGKIIGQKTQLCEGFGLR